jgi:transposase
MAKIDIRFLPEKDLYRVDEIAKFFGINRKTPYAWIAKWRDLGENNKYIFIPGVGIRIPRETIIIMIEELRISHPSTS